MSATTLRLKRILAVCDLSVASTNAAWRAGLLARDHGAWLRLLHVGWGNSSVARAKDALDVLAWELQERLKIAVMPQSVRGSFRREVAAAAGDADLVVIGRPPREAPAWWAPGTPSRRVLAHALADVLVLPALATEPLPSAPRVDIALS